VMGLPPHVRLSNRHSPYFPGVNSPAALVINRCT
jgi:hypothetical protein